jgi:hypothetical protein
MLTEFDFEYLEGRDRIVGSVYLVCDFRLSERYEDCSVCICICDIFIYPSRITDVVSAAMSVYFVQSALPCAVRVGAFTERQTVDR